VRTYFTVIVLEMQDADMCEVTNFEVRIKAKLKVFCIIVNRRPSSVVFPGIGGSGSLYLNFPCLRASSPDVTSGHESSVNFGSLIETFEVSRQTFILERLSPLLSLL
jgi:hypothetical protein